MLVLARRIGQRLRLTVGEQTIWVTVLEVDEREGRVKLGIEASRDCVVVEREEIIGKSGHGKTRTT